MTSSSNKGNNKASGGRKRRPWLKRDAKGPKISLQERDRRIVEAVYRYRFLTTSQIQERFFPSKGKAVFRLRKLFDHGYLDRLERPASAGREEIVYALWDHGAELLEELTGEVVRWRRKHNQVKELFLAHELEVIAFRLKLEQELPEHPECELVSWQYERDYLAVGDGREAVEPDSCFELQTPRGRALFFLEIDRGTETVSRVFARKIERYVAFLEGGGFEEVFERKAFRVLTVTTGVRRLRSLVEVVNLKGGRFNRFFWFSTTRSAHEQGILEKTWSMAGAPGWWYGII